MTTESSNILSKTNLAISAGLALVALFQLFVLPLWLHGHAAAMIAAVLLLMPLNLPFWSTIHEAVHRHLHAGRTMNEFLGRALSVLFGIPFQVLRFGHLMHHQYNREWETEIYDPKGGRIGAILNHYGKMLGGLYISEVGAAFAIALLPAGFSGRMCRHVFADDRHHDAALRSLLKPDNVRRTRLDCMAIAAVYGASFALYGAAWFVPLIVVLGRAFLISLFDNAYHYGTPPDNSVPAKELQTSAAFSRFLMHFNHHLTHHRNPGLAWHKLAESHPVYCDSYSESLLHATVVQFRGPIFAGEQQVEGVLDSTA